MFIYVECMYVSDRQEDGVSGRLHVKMERVDE